MQTGCSSSRDRIDCVIVGHNVIDCFYHLNARILQQVHSKYQELCTVVTRAAVREMISDMCNAGSTIFTIRPEVRIDVSKSAQSRARTQCVFRASREPLMVSYSSVFLCIITISSQITLSVDMSPTYISTGYRKFASTPRLQPTPSLAALTRGAGTKHL